MVNLSNILNIWMDVQREWVYLEGIFFGSSDIQKMLSNEYERFSNVDREFLNIMRQKEQHSKVLDVILHIPNLLKNLEYLSESLEKIKKSLSDYLETQRQAFSRFYFVGDEDLLEIIGNSKEITNIQKYFSKMFAGINSIANKEGNVLTGMISKEQEKVDFNNEIKV